MSELLQFPDNRKIMEEAAWWLVSVEEGLTDDERREFESWIDATPRHEKALLQLAKTSQAMDALSELADLFPLESYRARRSHAGVLRYSAVAASLAGVVAVSWFALAKFSGESGSASLPGESPESGLTAAAVAGQNPADAARSYETDIGEQLSARLPDGTVITLNTDTRLDIDFTGEDRAVTIQRGEASFDVEHDPSRPFRVRARDTVVQALGTIFNVQVDPTDGIEVTVTEGNVRVTAPPAVQRRPATTSTRQVRAAAPAQGIDVTVGAGELAVISGPEGAVRRIESLEIEAQLSWQQGMLIFRGSPLDEVLADVSRYTTVRFTIADESIRSTRVGGYFRAGDVDALLVALRESFGIEPQRVGEEIILTARE